MLSALAEKLPEASEPARPDRCEPGTERSLRADQAAYAAVAQGRTVAYVQPGGPKLKVFGRRNINGFPTVFGVLAELRNADCDVTWYYVQLPVKPNGATGYVRAADVAIGVVDTRIEIDLSARRIDVFRDGRRIRKLTTAVGRPETPTPTGSYYVNQRLVAPDPSGPFGPAALGISAFSPVLQEWVQGGPIAIHGTNDPQSVGDAASHGCLRVRNDRLVWLFREIPAGTPVEITA
jgi:lipoprotein-anchoring transpeptidase ErfK/SrfK